jgi:putative two-component system response regulator
MQLTNTETERARAAPSEPTVGVVPSRRAARIAIVDDEPINIKVVRKHLQRAGYDDFVTTSDAAQAMGLIRSERPDVVLLDVMMPRVNGIEILEAVRADPALAPTPVLILTASTDADTKLRALTAGATDFLAKPVDPNELIPRLRNALIVKAHQDHLASYSEQLEREVRLRTAELEVSRLQVVHCLARAAEFRDDTTGRHVLRVGSYAAVLAAELGFAPAAARMLGLAAQLHDVGKIGLPDAVLLKPGKLTPAEYDVVRRHCDIGVAIVQPMRPEHLRDLLGWDAAGGAGGARNPLLEMAARIAHAHHERWDGSGYPRGLASEAIPVEARITAVADVFDALSTARPYKPAYPIDRCLAMLEEGRGTQFDPAVLDALRRRTADIARAAREQADAEVPGHVAA